MPNKIKISWPSVENETDRTNDGKYTLLVDATMDLTQKAYSATANRSHDRIDLKQEQVVLMTK